MIPLLLRHIQGKPPLVLLPGLYGSALTATYEKEFRPHWYCPKEMKDELFWVKYKFAVPPVFNCLFEMLRGHYDEETQQVTSPPGLTIDVPDFGGDEGIEYVDADGIIGFHIIESFATMLKYLKGKGYTIKKDLFGAPYDWRLAMAGLETTFFPKLKALIEEAYEKNEQQKVTVLGYSCGGFCIQRFFGNYCSQEWKDKYISKAIFLAPAFAGSADTLDVAWNRYFPILPILKTDTLQETIETVPCIHSLFPNPNVFGDKPLFRGPDGEETTAKDATQFLIDHGKYHKENVNLVLADTKVIYEVPKDPGVPLMMLYNTEVPTAMTMDFKKGYDEKPEVINEEGDGTVPAIGPEWACNNWKANNALVCYNVKQEDGFDHGGMSKNAFVHDIIYKYITTDDWVAQRGARFVTAPHVEMFNNYTSYRLTGLRDEQVRLVTKD